MRLATPAAQSSALGVQMPGIARECGCQIADALAHVAPQGHSRPVGAAELLGDDIEMDDGLALGRDGEALGGDLAQLAAGDQQHVGLVDQRVGDAVVAAEEAGAQRVGAGDRPLAGHGVGNRYGVRAGERRHLGGGLRDVHATAAQHQGPLGLGQQTGGTLRVVGRRPAADGGRRLMTWIDGELGLLEGQRAMADVLRHVDHNRAGPAGGGNQEGAADQLGDAAGVLDAQEVLGGGPQDLGLARLLGHVFPGVGRDAYRRRTPPAACRR